MNKYRDSVLEQYFALFRYGIGKLYQMVYNIKAVHILFEKGYNTDTEVQIFINWSNNEYTLLIISTSSF